MKLKLTLVAAVLCALSFSAPALAVPPANTAPPQISGAAHAGQTLTADPGSWSGETSGGFGYQWQRCDTQGASCSPIAGATSSTYPLQFSEIGATIVVSVTALDGPTTAASSATAVVRYPVPAGGRCVLVPRIGDADATVFVVSCENWSDYFQATPLTYSYQWWGCAGDGENCSLEYTNPLTTVPQGESIVSGFFNGDPSWGTFLAKVVICQADGSCTTWSDIGYLSDSGAPHNNPAAPPTISGNVWLGQQLSAESGAWSNDPTGFSHQWYSCSDPQPGYEYWQRHEGVTHSGCTPISGATGSTYTPQPSDYGSALLVEVVATNALGFTAVVDSPTSALVVHAPPTSTAPPTLTVPGGHPVSGDSLSGDDGSWAGGVSGFGYQWKACDGDGLNCQPIAEATSTTYTVSPSEIGATIVLEVTATNSDGLSTRASSLPTASVDPTAPASTVQPQIDTSAPLVGTPISATSGSWTGAPAPAGGDFGYQWYRCGDLCTTIGGASSQTYTPLEADVGYRLAVVVTASTDGGVGSSDLNDAVLTDPVARAVAVPAEPELDSSQVEVAGTVNGTVATPTPAPTPTDGTPAPAPVLPGEPIDAPVTEQGRTIWGESSNPLKQVIVSANLDDIIRTGSGNDVIRSFGGRDTIFNGRGAGFVYAGAGNDVIWAQHGYAVVYCGPGIDRVYANRFVRTIGCETVIVASNNRWVRVRVDRKGFPILPASFVRPYFKG